MYKISSSVKKIQSNTALTAGACIALAYLVSGAEISSFKSTINIAVAGAASPVFAICILLGSLVRYLFAGNLASSVIHIAALVIISSIRWISGGKLSSARSAVFTAFAMLFSSVVVGITVGYDFKITIVFMCMSIITGAATFFINECKESFYYHGYLKINGLEGASLGAVYVIALVALCSVQLFFLNLGRILAVYVILSSSKKYRHFGGAVCGILSSCAIMLGMGESGMSSSFLGVSGLVVGLFTEMNPILTAFFFLFINASGMLVTGISPDAFLMSADILVGGFLYVCIPSVYLNKLFIKSDEKEEYSIKHIVSRLKFMMDSLYSVRKKAEKISEVLERRAADADMCEVLPERVCAKCRNKLLCWSEKYSDTIDGMRKLQKYNRIDVQVTGQLLPCCIKRQEICNTFNLLMEKQRYNKVADVRFKELQSTVFEQMRITEKILEDGFKHIESDTECDLEITRRLCAALDRDEIKYSFAVGYFSSGGIKAEIYFDKSDYSVDENKLCGIVELEFDKPLECREAVYAGQNVKVVVEEKNPYDVRVAYSQNTDGKTEACGDSFDSFYDGFGNAYMVLADGMGRGVKASAESGMALSYFKKLIRSGIECGNAIEMVNSIMVSKSREENFTTLDITKINLETGMAKIFKLGASATLIKSRGVIMKINAPSFPVGIVRNAEPFEKEIKLEKDDEIVMLSDGVEESEYPYIKTILMSGKKQNLKGIADTIKKHADEKSDDDITVAIMKFYESF